MERKLGVRVRDSKSQAEESRPPETAEGFSAWGAQVSGRCHVSVGAVRGTGGGGWGCVAQIHHDVRVKRKMRHQVS